MRLLLKVVDNGKEGKIMLATSTKRRNLLVVGDRKTNSIEFVYEKHFAGIIF